MHTQIVGAAASCAMTGAGVFPLICGAVANRFGVQTVPLLPAIFQAASLCITCEWKFHVSRSELTVS
jgi:fucose permease